MDGVELAKRLKIQSPNTNIIFTTGFSEYMADAFSIHANSYVLKPVTAEKISDELSDLRHPLVNTSRENEVTVHAFGNFEVYVNGVPVVFSYSKAKELFAYLVDRQGALCSNNEIMAVLWEDEAKESYFRSIRADLMKALPTDIFVKQWREIGVKKEKLTCDYYDWIEGKLSAINT